MAGHGHVKALVPPPQTNTDEAVEGPEATGVALRETNRNDDADCSAAMGTTVCGAVDAP